ncbi:NAD(+) diphosphatase [Arthrobacter sp. E918]|uniref:NAD(+) diphosphatase n=2 Tax=Arthrobacter mobilis TaxID=2724944 RepID=A0A7X6HCU9_9MICC|nr:NAD(+) diphosphatase [Arthrobacter mobilis]
MDRGCDRRARPGLLEEIWGAATTSVMLMSSARTLVRGNKIVLLPSEGRPLPASAVYLGRAVPGADVPAGTDIVLEILEAPEEAGLSAADDGDWLGLREVAADVSAQDAGLFVEAAAISNWHASHTHCPLCGTPTRPEQGGWVRRCPSDNSEHFPRTDPAIIVSVLDEQDRILLGHNKSWPVGRYSTLAGFVEPGESLEAAVIREVEEESGVLVQSPQYMGSQPWPFPASLMLGFTATAVRTDLTPDGVEISDVRWFSREELADGIESGEVRVAPGISIARALIEHWYGGPLPEPRAWQ